MKRRLLLSSIAGAAVAPAIASGQTRTWRLGLLTPTVPLDPAAPPAKFLLDMLAQRGYRPGENLAVTTRGARGQTARLATMVQEFKAERVDVLVTSGYPATLAAKDAGIPTVVVRGVGDPIATRLIDSLARPGGTLTGISDDANTLSIKRLSLLKELRPALTKVAMLWNRDDLGMSLRYKASADAAQSMGISVQALGVREPNDFEGVFEAMKREPPGAILMVSDSLTLLNRKRVIDYAAAERLPAIYETDGVVRDGGLMSYAADDRESFERGGALVERIFKGAKPGELPFEQPTRYLFVINLKTAKALGLTLPPALLARADDVIE
jgi:putative tryptophan/tyrosine transport system substrate-binding protein